MPGEKYHNGRNAENPLSSRAAHEKNKPDDKIVDSSSDRLESYVTDSV